MKSACEVKWADIAVNDLKAIIDFISRDSPADASDILQTIYPKTTSLSSFPERGGSHRNCRIKGLRFIVN